MSIVKKALDKVVNKLNKTSEIDKQKIERILQNNKTVETSKKQG